MASGNGKKSRPGARGLVSLLPDIKTESEADLAEAFIGRFMSAGDGVAYEMFAEPYCESSGSYDRRSVLRSGMDGMEFFRCLCWLLENKSEINSYSMSRAARLYELGRLPYGKIAGLSMRVVDEIIQAK